MGAVYLGTDERTGESVAVKVLTPALVEHETFRERFKAEIASLEKLRHPNIVQLFGYGEQDQYLYYAMELVDGTSLQDELSASRRFDWREVVRLGVDICRALKHAHDHGIIHRDIKPANLLLTSEEQIKLSDFGIAKLFGNTHMTADGGILGTADYMSPEQAMGQPATPRCDIYSLGSVLYALLAGRPPFVGKSLPEVIHKLRYDAPYPVRRFAPDTPEALEQLLESLLSKDPQDRVPTAIALAHRLQQIRDALTISTSNGDDSPHGNVTHGNSPHRGSLQPDSTPDFLTQDSALRHLRQADELASRETAAMPSDNIPVQESSASTHSELRTSSTHRESIPAFTQVSPQPASRHVRRESGWQRWGAALASVPLLVGLSAIVYWALRPPTAEQLASRIESQLDDDSPDAILHLESDVNLFLDRFPNDPHRESIEDLSDRIDALKWERRLILRARQMHSATDLSALEQALLNAIRLKDTDLSNAASHFQAIVDVYESTDGDSETAHGVAFARRQLEILNADIHSWTETRLELLHAKMTRAESLATDHPQEAAAIYRGILVLYADAPWAADIVQQARSRLQGLSQHVNSENASDN